ncbi:hypothetical protein BGZ80_011721 [Entomortierella chlamydospora]|uniref:Uncharacterized protein n=1 Tax=Entomortierella chlamydospora TaxID=101097 RepID=A0A9P6N3V5_9FUNG|nr:hypothetical protein BGZ79_009452 [Entomortierella chlamydospora]KAG0022575.1 hypothetical protein BGZ80_011721 [Entomortierella chlamydospora]
MKKSMQKRKKAQQARTPSQAQTPQAQSLPKKQLKKRQLKDVLDSETETAQYVNQAQTQSTTATAASKRSRARLISAYETIVFSESQIPVFLSQDQHHRRRSKISPQKSVAPPATIKENKSETQVSGSDKRPSDSSQINVALFKRGNPNAMDKDNTQSPSINDNDVVGSIRDKNSLVEHPSSSSSTESKVQDDEYHSALEKSSSDLTGKSYLARHSPDYDDQDYAHLSQWCASKHAILLVLFLAMLLIAYRVYSRKQRRAALLLLPQFEHVSESKLKDSRRASESSRGSDDMTSFVGYNIQ